MFNISKMTIIAGAALFGLAATGSAKAWDKRIDVVNASHLPIVNFYASNVGTDSWEEDILGTGILPPGYQVRVNLDDGTSYCHFDLKTRFADGSSVIRRDVDICAVTRFTLYD